MSNKISRPAISGESSSSRSSKQTAEYSKRQSGRSIEQNSSVLPSAVSDFRDSPDYNDDVTDVPETSETSSVSIIPDDEAEMKLRFARPQHEYSFEANGNYVYYIYAYCIQKWIAENAESYYLGGQVSQMKLQVDYDRHEPIMTYAHLVFQYKGEMFEYVSMGRECLNTINGVKPVTEIVRLLKDYIKTSNPLKGKNVYVTENGFLLTRPKQITFDDVIMNDAVKQDIYDNSIYQLVHMDDNNGLIFEGSPGIGKSLLVAAILNKANLLGFSTCYITQKVNFISLEEFINMFMSPCIVVFEDIDSMGQSREATLNTDLSTLLQFLSGIAEKNEKTIFIATTNYIEHLDKALSNRPMRFNRIYHFELPTNKEIDQLIALYFADYGLPLSHNNLCYNKKFTGAHLKEIHRTAKLMAHRKYTAVTPEGIVEVFPSAVDAVISSFKGMTKSTVGF